VHFVQGQRDSTGRVSDLQRRQYSDVLRIELAIIDFVCLCALAFALWRFRKRPYLV